MKWEYFLYRFLSIERLDTLQDRQGIFSKLGLDNWELISVDNGIAYFKRPIQPKSEAEILAQFDKQGSMRLVEGDESITVGGAFVDKDFIRGFHKSD